MQDPRLGFRLLVVASLCVGVAALQGGALRAAFGLAAAVALAWVARGRLAALDADAPPPAKAPRRTIGAGVAATLLGLLWLLGGAFWAGALTLVLGVAVVTEGARLSLRMAPLPEAPGVPSPTGPAFTAAVAADETMRLLWDFGGRITPEGSPGALAARIAAAAERSRVRGWLEDPSRAHPPPPALEKADVVPIELRGLPPALAVTFESEFEPFDAEIRDAYLGATANRRARTLLFRDGEPGPTLICIHGYGGGRAGLDARLFDVVGLRARVGVDVALYTLPLHGKRAVGRRSGARFLDLDPLWTDAAFAHAVSDLRRLAGWLRAEGAPLVGVTGASLGGYTTALVASLDERLACAVPEIPAAKLADLVWSEFSAERRAGLEAAGASAALLDEAWASHAPLRHRPRVAPGGRMIVAALGDRICPPAAIEALREHWDDAPVAWYPGTHMVRLGYAPPRRALEDHVRRTLVEAGPPVPLSRFHFTSPERT